MAINVGTRDIETSGALSGNSVPSDAFFGNIMEIFMLSMGIMYIFWILSFLLTAWGLWNINRKLRHSYAWIAWIPLIRIYSYYQAGNTDFLRYFVYPLLAYIAGVFLAVFTFGISMIIAVMYALFCALTVYHNISKATGRGIWSTVGMIFIPFIMFPIIGHKLTYIDPSKEQEKNENSDIEAIKPNIQKDNKEL